jgi:hypothetical protein
MLAGKIYNKFHTFFKESVHLLFVLFRWKKFRAYRSGFLSVAKIGETNGLACYRHPKETYQTFIIGFIIKPALKAGMR